MDLLSMRIPGKRRNKPARTQSIPKVSPPAADKGLRDPLKETSKVSPRQVVRGLVIKK